MTSKSIDNILVVKYVFFYSSKKYYNSEIDYFQHLNQLL